MPAVWTNASGELFRSEDGRWAAKWTGCAWVLERQTVLVSLECEDDTVAANRLFGNEFVGAGFASVHG